MRDSLGENHPDVPDLTQLTVHLQPERTGRYDESDYKPHFRPVIKDSSIKKVEQEELHHTRPLTRKAVILFSHPSEMDLFGSRSLFGRGKRLIYSTFNNNQYEPFEVSKWRRVNEVLNANNMSRETLNAIHHLGINEFETFIGEHAKAENILVIPNRDPEFVKDLIEFKTKNKINVISNLQAGEPYSLNGQPLKRQAVSYPGKSA